MSQDQNTQTGYTRRAFLRNLGSGALGAAVAGCTTIKPSDTLTDKANEGYKDLLLQDKGLHRYNEMLSRRVRTNLVTKYVAMGYPIGYESLDELFQNSVILERTWSAKDLVFNKYISIDWEIRSAELPVPPTQDRMHYDFVFLGEVKGTLERELELALRDFIQLAGLPSFFVKGSDYDLVNKILGEYQSILKEKGPIAFVEKTK